MVRGSCFFFKQKTAYEMRIRVWSSDVYSSQPSRDSPSDSPCFVRQSWRLSSGTRSRLRSADRQAHHPSVVALKTSRLRPHYWRLSAGLRELEFGRASCGERVCQYVELSVVAV